MRLKMNDYPRHWDNKRRCWVYRHRETVETYLGRKLNKDEHIHHINEDVNDNRVENLELVTVSSHMSKHSPVYLRVSRPVKAHAYLGCKSLALITNRIMLAGVRSGQLKV